MRRSVETSDHRERRLRRRRRFAAALVGVLLALVTLEAVMQVVAYGMWRSREQKWRTEEPATGEPRRRVLCVGDSFTAGLGASSEAHSYPAELERLLNQDQSPHSPWQVIHRGVPGNDSVDVVARLPEFLQSLTPEVVCILIGYNDRWRTRLDADVELPPLESLSHPRLAASFEWRLRTLQLLARLTTWSSEDEPLADTTASPASQAATARLLGTWHAPAMDPPTQFVFESGGRLRLGTADLSWRSLAPDSAGRARVAVWTGDRPERSLTWWRQENQLLLEGGAWSDTGPLTLEPGPPPASPIDRARQALRSGDLAKTQRLLPAPPLTPAWLAVKIEWHHRRGDSAEVSAHLDALEARGSDASGAFIRTSLQIGRVERALRYAKASIAARPNEALGSNSVWGAIAPWAIETPDRGRQILPLLEHTLDLPGIEDQARGIVLSVRARTLFNLGEDPVGALADAIRADLLLARSKARSVASQWRSVDSDRPLGITAGFLAGRPAWFTDDVIAETRRRLELTASDSQKLDELLRAVRQPLNDHATKLEIRLRHCVALAKHQGARVLLLTYPEPMRLTSVIRRVATTSPAELVDISSHFTDAMRQTHRSEWFIADGHCNDRGYAQIARVVADHLLR